MFRTSYRAAVWPLLAAVAFLATPAKAADPVFLINATDKPWRLLSHRGLHQPVEVTTQGEGAQATRRVHPALDFQTWVGIRGTTLASSGEMRRAYTDFFVLDTILPPGRTIQIENAGVDPRVHINFFLCDVKDRAIDLGSGVDGKEPTLLYEVNPPAGSGPGARVVRWKVYPSAAETAPVLQFSDANPTVLTIVGSDWGLARTFICHSPTKWSERAEPWEAAAKASGADPIRDEIAWVALKGSSSSSTRDLETKTPAPTSKSPAPERKD